MKVPKKFQIFDLPVKVSQADSDRLAPYLSGWPVLAKWFYSPKVNEPDLQRLIVIELSGQARLSILERLASRLGSLSRWRVKDRIRGLL
jgi:hypothetical protein